MFSIRYASLADIPLIRKLTFQIWPQTYASTLTQDQIDYMLEMMYSETSLTKQMNEGAQFIIVYDHDKPVGFASFREIKPLTYKLHKIYIHPDQQGKGAGRFTIDHILGTIKESGAISLELQVNRHNKARDFYEKLGFEVVEEADFDIGNGFFMNDYIMKKNV